MVKYLIVDCKHKYFYNYAPQHSNEEHSSE
jgi:hypothetical protein